MNEIEKKISGKCSNCDADCFVVTRLYPDDHFLAGEPRNLGQPLDHAYLIGILITDGKTLRVTMCENCAKTLSPKIMNHVWRRILYSWKVENTDDHLKALAKPPLKPSQRKKVEEWLREMSRQSVLGVVCNMKWSDYRG